MRIFALIFAVLTIAVSGPTWTSSDLIGKWKCNFTSSSGISGVLYTSTKSLGITTTTAVVNGHTSLETDHWSYKASGPATAVLTMTSPTLAAQEQAQAAELHRPIPPAPPYVIHLHWLSRDHLLETGSDGVHSSNYDCKRTQ